MKKSLLFLPIAVVAIFSLGFKPGRAVRDLMEWNDTLKVNWEDYKGNITDTGRIALSSCGIYCIPQTIGDSGEITLMAYFDRNKSWANKKHTDSLFLVHEQGHFDLTEAYTRLLRKKISSIRPDRAHFTSEIQKFYNWTWDDLQKQQAAYDKATDHGAVDLGQRVWNAHIQSLLLQNSKYAVQTVKIRIAD